VADIFARQSFKGFNGSLFRRAPCWAWRQRLRPRQDKGNSTCLKRWPARYRKRRVCDVGAHRGSYARSSLPNGRIWPFMLRAESGDFPGAESRSCCRGFTAYDYALGDHEGEAML